jgi:hypothetical protein
VVSRKALKEVQLEKRACVVCQQECKDGDLIDLNLEPERIELMRRAVIERRKKKEKKEEGDEEVKPRKLVKEDAHIGAMDRLSGEFRDVIRNRGSRLVSIQISRRSSRRSKRRRTGRTTPTWSKRRSRPDSLSL